MKHILFAIGITLICALLKWVGERFNHNAQRYVMPVIVGLAIYIDLHYKLCAVTPLLAIAVIVLGYKFYGKSDFWDRFLWLMDCEVFLWLGCAVLAHLDWRVYLVAIAVSGVWGAITRACNNNWVAPLSGAILGIVYYFVH